MISSMNEEAPQEKTSSQPDPVSRSRALLDRIVMIRSTDVDPMDRSESDARVEKLLEENPESALALFTDMWREYIQKQLAEGRTIKQMKRYEGGPAEGDFPPNPIYGLLKQAVKKKRGGFEEAVERIVQDILDEEDR